MATSRRRCSTRSGSRARPRPGCRPSNSKRRTRTAICRMPQVRGALETRVCARCAVVLNAPAVPPPARRLRRVQQLRAGKAEAGHPAPRPGGAGGIPRIRGPARCERSCLPRAVPCTGRRPLWLDPSHTAPRPWSADISYKLRLPKQLILNGTLSSLQLEVRAAPALLVVHSRTHARSCAAPRGCAHARGSGA